MRYVLDSTFVIDLLRGEPAAMERLEALHTSGDDPIVTSVTTAEIWSGLLPGTEDAIERTLRYLEYVPAGPDAARLAGTWRGDARRAGRTLDVTDALIAATALDLGAVVLTRNVRDFALTPVRVETY